MNRPYPFTRRVLTLAAVATAPVMLASGATAAPDWAWSMPATTIAGPVGAAGGLSNVASGVDPSGVVTLAWRLKTVAGERRIMVARYPAAGALTPLGPAVDLTASFSGNPGASNPNVAVSPNGDAVVAWFQPSSAGGYDAVWVSRYSASGGSWDAPYELIGPSSALNPYVYSPVPLAAGPQGEFTVAWFGATGGSPNGTAAFVASRFDGTWSTPAAISPTYSMYSDNWSIDGTPGVAADGLGNAVVLWAAKQRGGANPGVSKMLSARFTAGGTWSSAGSPTTAFAAADNNQNSVVLTQPSVQGNTTGDFVAAWRNFEGAAAQIQAVRSSGSGWAAAQNVGASGSRSDPTVALEGTGTATVAWVNWSSDVVESSTSLGSAPGTWAQALNAPAGGVAASGDVKIGASAAGDLTAVWEGRDATTSQYKIQANHLPGGSSAWSAPTTLQAGAYQSSSQYDTVQYPTVAVSSSGVATAAWENVVSYRPSGSTEYYIKGSRYEGSDPAPGPDPQPNSGGGTQGGGASSGGSSTQPSGSTQAEVTVPEQLAREGLRVSAGGSVRLPLACPSGLPSSCDAEGDLSMTLPRALQAQRGVQVQSAGRVRVLARFRGVEIESGRTRLYSVRLAPRTYKALRRAGYRRVPATLRVSNRVASGAVTVSRQRVWLRILPMKVAVTG